MHNWLRDYNSNMKTIYKLPSLIIYLMHGKNITTRLLKKFTHR